MIGSPRFHLGRNDLLRIARGAGLAAAGAVVTFLISDVLPRLDNSTTTGAALAALAATLLNAVHKWLSDTRRPAA